MKLLGEPLEGGGALELHGKLLEGEKVGKLLVSLFQVGIPGGRGIRTRGWRDRERIGQ